MKDRKQKTPQHGVSQKPVREDVHEQRAPDQGLPGVLPEKAPPPNPKHAPPRR